MENSEKSKPIFQLSKKERKWILISGLILFFLPLIFTSSNLSFISFKDTGDIGDTIGGITSPFLSFFGSVLVYLALKAQIDANNKINEQFIIQQQKDNIQSFENSFFNLVNFHLNIVNSTEKTYIRGELYKYNKFYIHNSDLEYTGKGKQVFEIEYDEIYVIIEDSYYQEKRYIRGFREITFDPNESRLSVFKKIYNIYYRDQIDNQFGNYFRNLYRLIKIIDEYDFKIKDAAQDHAKKYFYTSIIRAQFSDYELKWLFINGLSELGTKFKPLIEKYSLLKNIHQHDEALIEYFKFYDKKAFGK